MMKLYTLASGILLAATASAQAPYAINDYTYAPNDKYAPGAISTLSERTLPVSGDRAVYFAEDFDAGFGAWEAAIQEGPVGFKLTDVGHENDPENTFQIPVLDTSTPDQWVVLDSDGDNASYAVAEAATLTSPAIDLSDAADGFVALTFDQFFAEWQPAETSDHCYIGVSIDGGGSWVELEINEGVGREARPNPERISWDITDVIDGGESEVYIRFRWEGAWNYGWQIDNIQIEDINESDLMIKNTYRMYDEGIVYSQMAQGQARPFVIGAVVKNIGHIEQTNVGFSYAILDPSGTEVASGVATDVIPSLQNNEQDTILHLTDFTPTVLGNYTVEWTAIADDADDNEADNDASDAFFELTEFTMALDYEEGPTYEIDNWPLKVGEAYFGNLMTFANDGVATSMKVKITDYLEIEGETIKVAVWEVIDGGTEWLLTYDSDDYEIREADLGGWVNFDLEEFDVNTTSLYLFCAYQYASGLEPIFERRGDIGFNNIQGRDDEFANRGFFDRSAPLVRVTLNEGEVSVEDESKDDVLFAVYPNPANDFITVRFAQEQATQTAINVVDITGKTVKSMDLGLVNGTQNVNVSLDDLTAGIYFVELVTPEGKEVKKFIKK